MVRRKTAITSGILLVIILFALHCAINPVTGKKELMLISEQDEIALGQETDQEIAQTYGIYEDPALQEYVSRLGNMIAKTSHRPQLAFQFKVLDTDVINAFAVPGGYVYVTRGILAYLNDEAELAGVLGHEIGHVCARHSAQQMSQQQLAQLGLGLGMMLSEKLRKYSELAQFGVGMLFLKFSRDNERQADDLGVEYGTKTGYDTDRMAAFFETLERLSPNDGSGLPDWFSTHPNPVNRIQAVRNKTAEWKQKVQLAQYAVNHDGYLKTVNGIIFGEDPRQGYMEGNAFYHPTMKFTFPIPTGWQVQNTPAQVQVISDKEDAVILLTAGESASASQAANQFVRETNAAVQTTEALTVNGLQAQKLTERLITEEDTLQAMSYFIAKGGMVFALHGLAGRDNFSQYASTFSRTLGGFKNLDDPSKINVTPKKLIVKSVAKAGTLQSFLKIAGVQDNELENLAVMNGMQLTDNVSSGMRIKVVSK